MTLHESTRLNFRDIPAAAEMLSRAFFDDPNFAGLIDDDTRRQRLLPKLMAYAVREGILFGESLATSPQMEGVAVWHHPHVSVSLFSRIFRVGIYRAPFEFGIGLTRRILQCVDFLDEMREKYGPSEHWHLQLLGVAPERQRQGHAKRLLLPMLNRCDRDGIACFLDTQNPVNLTFYKRFGFHVVHECTVPPADVNCWFLQRNPNPTV